MACTRRFNCLMVRAILLMNNRVSCFLCITFIYWFTESSYGIVFGSAIPEVLMYGMEHRYSSSS
jgi:predicted branched-subunit amino acid permease